MAWLPSARKNDRVASASLRKALIGKMSFVGHRPDVPGYADKLVGEDRDVQKRVQEFKEFKRSSFRPMGKLSL